MPAIEVPIGQHSCCWCVTWLNFGSVPDKKERGLKVPFSFALKFVPLLNELETSFVFYVPSLFFSCKGFKSRSMRRNAIAAVAFFFHSFSFSLLVLLVVLLLRLFVGFEHLEGSVRIGRGGWVQWVSWNKDGVGRG